MGDLSVSQINQNKMQSGSGSLLLFFSKSEQWHLVNAAASRLSTAQPSVAASQFLCVSFFLLLFLFFFFNAFKQTSLYVFHICGQKLQKYPCF